MSKYRGKKALVVGLGASGVEVSRFLTKQGAKVTVTDLKQKSELADFVNPIAELKLEYDLGKANPKTFQAAEMIVLSPAVPPSAKMLDESREKQIPILGEIDIAAASIKEPLIAITGTNGKTTVATLLHEMFAADSKVAFLAGPDHVPLLKHVNDEGKADVVVCELSAAQLELTTEIFPAAAVFTSMDPDHLDRYPDYQNYIATKKKLLKFCGKNSYVVMNYDDPILASWGAETQGRLLWITKRNPIEIGGSFAESFTGCYFDAANKRIVAKINGKEEVYDTTHFKPMGEHNKENLMSAIAVARSMGISPKAVNTAIAAMKPVPHRLEFVRKKDGVYFFNDSKGTNPASLQRALLAFRSSPVILISGGKDRNAEFGGLTELVSQKVKILILLGEAKEKVNRAIGDFSETFLVGTFEEAVLLAYQKSRSGDIILLSPGCDANDMFRNYEERGNYFKKLVTQL